MCVVASKSGFRLINRGPIVVYYHDYIIAPKIILLLLLELGTRHLNGLGVVRNSKRAGEVAVKSLAFFCFLNEVLSKG